MARVRTGRPARGTRTGRPIMVLLDLLGRRWALRILWELDAAAAPLPFNELLERCAPISPSVLSQRLRELGDNGLVETRRRGYALTRVARGLREPLTGLQAWAGRWARAEARRTAEGGAPGGSPGGGGRA